MMMFKACPRCSGDLRETSDTYGRYMHCIQCGHVHDLPDVRFGAAAVAEKTSDKDAAAA